MKVAMPVEIRPRIAALAASGLTDAAIAVALGIPKHTARHWRLKSGLRRVAGGVAPLEERFRLRTKKTAGCWLWSGRKNSVTGYGVLAVGGKLASAHRVAWLLEYGAWPPPSLCVCHRCDVRLCVNPAHLFLGTRADNMADMARKGRGGGRSRRLLPGEVREIRALAASGTLRVSIARQFGVTTTTVHAIVARRSWGKLP